MKTFYEMLRIIESEEVKTPEGNVLTPEELEYYEREKSPMYKALFLKDIDAKRRIEQGRPSAEIELKLKKKQEEAELEKERAEKEKQDKLDRENRINTMVDLIRTNKTKNFAQAIIAVIGHVMEGMRESNYGLRQFKSILSTQLGDFGLRLKGSYGDKALFDDKLHNALNKEIKQGDPIVLKSDLLMYMDEPIVIRKAKVHPLNFQEEHTRPEDSEKEEAINTANKHPETKSLQISFIQQVLDCMDKATSVNSLAQMLLDVLRNVGVGESVIKHYLELYDLKKYHKDFR